MKQEEFNLINMNGWNKLSKGKSVYSNASLPEYGLFLEHNEEDLKLFENVNGAKILELGCAGGKSLKYLLSKGAKEVWGVDISCEQLKKAKELLPEYKSNFILSPMEELVNVPKSYFDYVYLGYSIGYCFNLEKTLDNINSYLKNDGTLIISWTHPFYFCLDLKEDEVIVNKSYFDDEEQFVNKGSDKVKLVQKNLQISTMLNLLISKGFFVEKLLEEKANKDVEIESNLFKREKNMVCPSTIIFKCKKVTVQSRVDK